MEAAVVVPNDSRSVHAQSGPATTSRRNSAATNTNCVAGTTTSSIATTDVSGPGAISAPTNPNYATSSTHPSH